MEEKQQTLMQKARTSYYCTGDSHHPRASLQAKGPDLDFQSLYLNQRASMTREGLGQGWTMGELMDVGEELKKERLLEAVGACLSALSLP